ncbi:hypothetical protein CWB65_01425 [Pseudoalteromonas sp. S554]|nr:hypothetical protein CWB65_01425 [Pseudoalteromonas sp. S554]
MPRYTQSRKTYFYPANFKIKAVKLSLRDDAISQDVAEALGVHLLILSTLQKYLEGILLCRMALIYRIYTGN